MVKILDAEILEWLQGKYEDVLEAGRKDWGGDNPHPSSVKTAKDISFDIEILKRLKIEAKERGRDQSSIFCFLLAYYMLRVDEIQYTENFMEAAVKTLHKYMAEKIEREMYESTR